MDKYKVNIKITTTAKNNMNSIHKYISDDLKSLIAADKLISEIKSKILSLKEYNVNIIHVVYGGSNYVKLL